jgi:hypothetical protein
MVSVTELCGTWRLVAWTVELIETGEQLRPFGNVPTGFIHFTPEGRLFAVRTASGRKPVATDEDQIAAFSTLVAYAGRYRIDGNTLVTAVDVSADPAMVGTELVRFFTLNGSDLEIKTAPFMSDKPSHSLGNRQLRSRLSWRREILSA